MAALMRNEETLTTTARTPTTLNASLPASERQKRLLPYMTFYLAHDFNLPSNAQQGQYNQNSGDRYQTQTLSEPKPTTYQQFHNKFNELTGGNAQQLAYVPKYHSELGHGQQVVLYQPKIKYTPFHDNNALPGPFQPMRGALHPGANQPKEPNYSAIYDKLAHLKLIQQNNQQQPPKGYGRYNPQQQQQKQQQVNYIPLVQYQDNNFKPQGEGKTVIHSYTSTNIDIPSGPSGGDGYHSYKDVTKLPESHQEQYISAPHQDHVSPVTEEEQKQYLEDTRYNPEVRKPSVQILKPVRHHQKPLRLIPQKVIYQDDQKSYLQEPKPVIFLQRKPVQKPQQHQIIEFVIPQKYESIPKYQVGPKYVSIPEGQNKYEGGQKYVHVPDKYEGGQKYVNIPDKYEGGQKYVNIPEAPPKYEVVNGNKYQQHVPRYEDVQTKYENLPKYVPVLTKYENAPKYEQVAVKYETVPTKYETVPTKYESGPVKYENVPISQNNVPKYESVPINYETLVPKYQDVPKYVEAPTNYKNQASDNTEEIRYSPADPNKVITYQSYDQNYAVQKYEQPTRYETQKNIQPPSPVVTSYNPTLKYQQNFQHVQKINPKPSYATTSLHYDKNKAYNSVTEYPRAAGTTEIPYAPTEDSNSLSNILKRLQDSNALPHTLTADNIDNSIKTLVRILSSLKKQQKFARPIVVPDETLSSEYEDDVNNEAGVGIGGGPALTYNQEHQGNHDGTSSQSYPADTQEGGTPGKPGVDYPALATIPPTSFNCKTQRYKGFFGDPDTHCQVWHYCDLNGGQASFLCPNGTIFSQVALTCDWWFNVKCSTTAQLYVLNERLYKYILPLSPKFPEDYSGPLVDRYLAMKFKEMEDKMKKQRKQNNDKDNETDQKDSNEGGEENDEDDEETSSNSEESENSNKTGEMKLLIEEKTEEDRSETENNADILASVNQ